MISVDDFAPQWQTSFSGTGLFVPTEVRPVDYLAFAEEDLAEDDTPRTRVNAVGNAKRALHLQVERLTGALGFERWQDQECRELRGFPRRLKFAELCGTIAPRVLAKVNRLRNEVEHDYTIPERTVIEDYVDIVGLYVAASGRYVDNYPNTRELRSPRSADAAQHCLHAVPHSGVLLLYACDHMTLLRAKPRECDDVSVHATGCMSLPEGIEALRSIDVSAEPSEYFSWVKLFLGGGLGA